MIDVTPALAVEALRHFVQDHGNEHTVIGLPGKREVAEWMAGLLGFAHPPSYLAILERHNGLSYQLYSLKDSFEIFAHFRDRWNTPRHYWPVAGDGCGNYYVLANGRKDPSGESAVGFIESISSTEEPDYLVASSYAHFAFFWATRLCAEKGCGKHLQYPRARAWPFDADFVLSVDPNLERIQPRDRWPH